MQTDITAIGNEGFEIVRGGARIFIDAFYHPALEVGAAPCRRAADIRQADLILVSHAHSDHFDPRQVADAAARTGARIGGPATVTRALHGTIPENALITLEPPLPAKNVAASQTGACACAGVTAFRTFHSKDHNSYLVETGGFRFFHDGDNEKTQLLQPAALGRIDALFIGPWQGSGWVRFVEAVRPRKWFLMHLTEEELDQQAAGTFLNELCDHVPLPERLVVLRPGQSIAMP